MAIYPGVGDVAGVDGLPFVVRASLSLPNAHGISCGGTGGLSCRRTVLRSLLPAHPVLCGPGCSFQLDESRAQAGNLRLPSLIIEGRDSQDMTF